ncbi:MAG: M56 family metallopeptidase [Alteromonadaceae bacterium]|nr:M56 family metallopeptidase [Alteromonadaceae bacterium]
MIEWLIEQQIVLSVTLLLLIALEHLSTAKIGVRLMYRLWAILPIVLVLNNLPSSFTSIATNSFTRYVVGLTPNVVVADSLPLLLLWWAGVAAIFAVIGTQAIRLGRSVTHKAPDSNNVYYAKAATTPMLFGFVRPIILLPTQFASIYCPAQQRLILEHEHTHYQHYDHLWNAVALITAMFFWFNPLVWCGIRSFRINQELACDSRVLQDKTNNEKLLYAKALMKCAEHASTHLNTYPTFGEKSTMIKRLNLIKHSTPRSKVFALATIMIAAALTANVALANLPTASDKSDTINTAEPVVRVNPVYPAEAVQSDTEGLVVMQFDITETGTTDNIKVLESVPKGIFDESAVQAMTKWRYKPRVQGGQAQRQTGIMVQLDFKLSEDDSASSTPSAMEKIRVAAW